MLRAFSDRRYDYYELTQPLGLKKSGCGIKNYILPKGSIFVHDKNDDKLGSIVDGCLKLCRTPDGNCYGCICGGIMVLHSLFKDTDLFQLVQSSEEVSKMEKLKNLIADLENQLRSAREQLEKLRS